MNDLLYSSRTQFMIETLTNLKNNKVNRVAGRDGASEVAARMKKILSGLSKKFHGMFFFRNHRLDGINLFLCLSYGVRTSTCYPR